MANPFSDNINQGSYLLRDVSPKEARRTPEGEAESFKKQQSQSEHLRSSAATQYGDRSTVSSIQHMEKAASPADTVTYDAPGGHSTEQYVGSGIPNAKMVSDSQRHLKDVEFTPAKELNHAHDSSAGTPQGVEGRRLAIDPPALNDS